MFGLHVRARLLARGARANWVRQAQGCLSFVARTRSSVTAISATLPTTNAMGDPAHRFASVRYMATDVEPREIVDFEDDDLDGATAAEAITQAIAPTPWKSVVELPPKLRELIIKQTGDFSSTQLHYMFTEMCRELAERTATNLTQHHPESPESRAGAAIYQPPFVYSPTYTLAFTAYRAPIQFSILQRVMAEISTRRPDFTPKRVLDFGAGCGMAAWALDNVWPGETQAYTAIEPSRSMVDMAQKLLEDFPGVKFEGSITKFLEHNSIQRGERTSSGAAGVAKKVAFDMCIGSFLLGELTSDNARAAATKILFDQLRPGGIAVFAEPATPWGLRCVDSARQFLLANYSTPDSRNLGTAEVLAPWIPWEVAPSSSSEAKLCTFPQGRPVGIYTPSRRAKHSSTGRTQFVYLVVQKQHDNTLASPKAATSAQDPTDQLVSKQWAADFINQECGMIVGHPLKKKKHVHLYICDKHGKLHKRTVTKRRHGKGERKAWYRAARKASWGGYWPLSEELPVSIE